MNWFDNVKSYAQKFVGRETSDKIVDFTNSALTVLTKPIQTVTGRFETAKKTTSQQGATSLVLQGATNVVIAAAPFSSTIRAPIVSTISKLSPAVKLGGGAAVVFAGSYLAANPSKIPEPSGFPAAGADIPKEPSLQSGINYIKQHPGFSVAALTAGLLALGFTSVTIFTLLNNYSNTKAIKDNTEQIIKGNSPNIDNTKNDYKEQLKIIEANTKAQKDIIEANTKAQKEIYKYTILPTTANNNNAVAPSAPSVVAPSAVKVAPGGAVKKKKKKKKKVIKKKKKTRRSKRKNIKRRKNKTR